MFRNLPITYFALAAIFLAGSIFYGYRQLFPNQLPDHLVARIGDIDISSERLAEYMEKRGARLSSIAIKDQLLNELIDRETKIYVAKDMGLDQDPDVVAAYENALIAKLRQRDLEKRLESVEVSPQEIEEYFLSNIHKYTKPSRKRIALIQLDLPKGATESKLQQVLERSESIKRAALSQPESVHGFGSLAAKYSGDQASRYVGGDIGWQANEAKELPAELQPIVKDLNLVGQISPAVRAGDAIFLLKLIDIRQEEITPIETVASNLRIQIRRQKQRELEAEWNRALVQKAPIATVNKTALDQLQISPLRTVADTGPPRLPE